MQANNDFSVLFVYQECIVVVALNIVWCACRLAVGIIIAKLQGVSAFVFRSTVIVDGVAPVPVLSYSGMYVALPSVSPMLASRLSSTFSELSKRMS